MNKTFCDACGKEIPAGQQTGLVALRTTLVRWKELGPNGDRGGDVIADEETFNLVLHEECLSERTKSLEELTAQTSTVTLAE